MKSRLAFFQEHVLPAFVCFALALALSPLLVRFENLTLDTRTRLRAKYFPTKPRDDVALIGIDQASLNALGHWPWKRDEVHGALSQLLGRVKPSVVAWDILFDDPTEQDAKLANGIKRSGVPVVLGGVTVGQEDGFAPDDPRLVGYLLAPLPHVEGDRAKLVGAAAMSVPKGPLGQVADIGFVNAPGGLDGMHRELPLMVRVGDTVFPTLTLRSLMHHWHVTPDEVHVRLGSEVEIKNAFVHHRIPIDETGSYLINYRHDITGFLQSGYGVTLGTLYAKFAEKKQTAIPELTGRIVLIGQVADGLSDIGPTPLSPLTPLMLVHANVLENVLNGDFARHAAVWPIWLGGFVLTAGSLAFFAKRKFYHLAVFALGAPVVFAGAATLAWAKLSVWVPVVWPTLGFVSAQIFMVGRRVLAEQRAKEQIKGMFGTYLAPELVNRMAESGVAPQLGGHEEEITAYFSDIQGYSTFSEKLTPKELVDLLNTYLTACTDIVQEEGGTLDKYIGDAVVAMFGAPLPLSDHAYRACVAALRVQEKLDELRAAWDAAGQQWPEGVRQMRSRVGLNTGAATIGNMGSRSRFNYTMTGDNVNLAARMESGAKSWGVYTMCTEATRAACVLHGGDRVVFRPLSRLVVKGRSQAVPVFEIVGLREHVSAQQLECVAVFEQALVKYYARDWSGARALFERSRDLEANVPGRTPGIVSNPSLVYLDHVLPEAVAGPPPINWDGAYVMKEK